MHGEYILLNGFRKAKKVFIAGFHVPLRYNMYCISIVNTNQAQLMIVYKASNVCILLTFVSAIL